MSKIRKSTIEVQGTAIAVLSQKGKDFICLTDIARVKNADRSDDLVRNWLRNRNTVEFLGIWEHLNNPGFNSVEFDGIRMQAGLNSFALTPKQWIEKTKAIGIVSQAGVTAARTHTRISPLNSLPGYRSSSSSISLRNFNVSKKMKIAACRCLEPESHPFQAQLPHPYRRHQSAPDSGRSYSAQAAIAYANEADMLNVALFGQTANSGGTPTPTSKAT